MHIVRCESAQEFLDRTYDLRARDPLRTNVLGSVALSVANGSRNYDSYFWWVAYDNDEVAGLAMRTAPHGLLMGPSSSAAVAALAEAVAKADPLVPSVHGSHENVATFLDELPRYGVTRRAHEARRELLRAIDVLTPPVVEGELRVAVMDDLDLVMHWGRLFSEEIDLEMPTEEGTRSKIDEGSMFFWTVDDTVVSMAGHAPPVAYPEGVVARVGPVYTPVHQRGHGYAAAVTAEVTELLMREGSKVMLYADKANQVSNGVYARLGYYVVDENVRFEFDEESS